MDEFGRVFECFGLKALLLSVCHPGSADLNQQHEMEGSVPSCKFDETFCSLIPSWIHICHRREASTSQYLSASSTLNLPLNFTEKGAGPSVDSKIPLKAR